MAEQCLQCGTEIEEWDGAYYARNMLCMDCYSRKIESDALKPCRRCGMRTRSDQLKDFRGQMICPNCLPEAQGDVLKHECVICQKWIESWEPHLYLPDGRLACSACHDSSQKGGGRMRVSAGPERIPAGRPSAARASLAPRASPVLYYRPGAPSGQPVSMHAPLFSSVVERIGHYLGVEGGPKAPPKKK